MYQNLFEFIDKYKTTNSVNIPLLIYGKKYLLNSLLELQAVIRLSLFELNNVEKLNANQFFEILDLIDARLKEDELKTDKEDLVNWIKDKKESLKKERLLSGIQSLINKHQN